MPTGKALLEHLLYNVKDGTVPLVVVAVWMPPDAPTIEMQSVLISMDDLLSLVPAPLPVEAPPTDPPPVVVPPVVAPPPKPSPVKMIVAPVSGLQFRQTPGGTSVKPSLTVGAEVLVDETVVQGDKKWRHVQAVNGEARDGWICEQAGSEVYLIRPQ